MEPGKKVVLLSFILCAVAGFCDALTYVAAGGLFSAHVTGNFILFATNMANASAHDPWVKLLTFPVFIFSVVAGGWLGEKAGNRYHLLLIEGILLTVIGIAAFIAEVNGFMRYNWLIYFFAMLIVSAMGLQNAYGKLFPKETYAPTTMMTGNVTQWALNLKTMWLSSFTNAPASGGFKKLSLIIAGFLSGCLAGAFAGKYIGLHAVSLAGTVLLPCYFIARQSDLS